MSPNSTDRRHPMARRLAMAAAAVALTVLPAACGSAYADATNDAERQNDLSVGEILDSFAPTAGEQQEQDGEAAAPEEDGQSGDEGDEGAEAPAAEAPPAEGADAGGSAADESADGDGNNGGANAGGNNNAGGNGNDGDAQGGNEQGANEKINGLDVLGRDCKNSNLEPHNGFQEAPRCVDTAFGEVASEDKSPSLLITQAPDVVRANEEFTIAVSTRNLVRDRFLGAAQGGYYLESSFLDENGIQRGHFHTACRMLDNVDSAPDAAPAPEFFLATQDNGGGADPDKVTITVSGMPRAGTAQCAVWAGDGSHRIPMMQRANQTPAFDAVRITVE
jgi:hypothetical protein